MLTLPDLPKRKKKGMRLPPKGTFRIPRAKDAAPPLTKVGPTAITSTQQPARSPKYTGDMKATNGNLALTQLHPGVSNAFKSPRIKKKAK